MQNLTSQIYLPLINPQTAAISAKFTADLFHVLDERDECTGYGAAPDEESVIITIEWARGVTAEQATAVVRAGMERFEAQTGMAVDGRMAQSHAATPKEIGFDDPRLVRFFTDKTAQAFRKNAN